MLKLVRRHLLKCPHTSQTFKKCGCPIWLEGRRDGERIRKSLDTFNWEIASEKLLRIEAGDNVPKDSSPSEAVEAFLDDCKARNLGKATQGKYKETLTPLAAWCEPRGISTVRALFKLETLKKYVAGLSDSALTVGKKIERLRTFNKFCEELEWCSNNPAKLIKKPLVKSAPIIPFTAGEFKAIIDAVNQYPQRNSFGHDNRKRLRAFIYILRYAALRISDATKLRKTSVVDDRLMLRTQKTGSTVHVPLPPFVIEELQGLGNDEYFFWSGNGELKSCTADWQRSITKLFKLAKVTGHPHMFRHTMAVELLENGVTVEHVAAILGNTPAIVYKHYAPWVASRQKALDEAVKTVWVAKT
jgi:site-specific recombinase XerD